MHCGVLWTPFLWFHVSAKQLQSFLNIWEIFFWSNANISPTSPLSIVPNLTWSWACSARVWVGYKIRKNRQRNVLGKSQNKVSALSLVLQATRLLCMWWQGIKGGETDKKAGIEFLCKKTVTELGGIVKVISPDRLFAKLIFMTIVKS